MKLLILGFYFFFNGHTYFFCTQKIYIFLFVSLLSTALGKRRGRTTVSAKWKKNDFDRIYGCIIYLKNLSPPTYMWSLSVSPLCSAYISTHSSCTGTLTSMDTSGAQYYYIIPFMEDLIILYLRGDKACEISRANVQRQFIIRGQNMSLS